MTTADRNALREEACELNRALPNEGLVRMHSGNASVYDPLSGRLFIKPSGFDYGRLTPADMVEVDARSGQAFGNLRPSVDLPHHVYLYKHMPDIRAVIHTHSSHATAFAACLRPIPACLTAVADEFGGDVPCTPYVPCEGDAIGRAILACRSAGPAILLGNHGVFTWGPTGAAALKAAVVLEDAARTLLLAERLGGARPLPRGEAGRWHDRYQNRYGQAAMGEAA